MNYSRTRTIVKSAVFSFLAQAVTNHTSQAQDPMDKLVANMVASADDRKVAIDADDKLVQRLMNTRPFNADLEDATLGKAQHLHGSSTFSGCLSRSRVIRHRVPYGLRENRHTGQVIQRGIPATRAIEDGASGGVVVDNARIEKLISRLGAVIVTPPEPGAKEEDEANLWRELGTRRLDCGEYAEAHSIYRYGSERCPSNSPLRFIKNVYNAFHGNATAPPPVERTSEMPPPLEADDGDFGMISIDVSSSDVPTSILQFNRFEDENEALTRLVHISDDPILSEDACQYLIESTARAVSRKGWTTNRHIDAPTCDIPVFELDAEAVLWARNLMKTTLFPFIAQAFEPVLGVKADMLRIQDCFIVRYDGSDPACSSGPGFSSLNPHKDKSVISATIALNDQYEYEGGGLRVHSTGETFNGDAGTVICFAGGLVHEGAPVIRGTRWIMTLFLYIDQNAFSGKDAGYTLRQIKESSLREDTRQNSGSMFSWFATK